MRHLTIQQLSATVDDALSGVSLELVRRHLVECEECRQRGMRLSRIDAVMAQLVSHDPGDAWLAAHATEMEERIHGEITGRFTAPVHPAGPPPLEVVPRPGPLTPEQLDAIWEEGATTPRPSLASAAVDATSDEVASVATSDSNPPLDPTRTPDEAKATDGGITADLIADEPAAWSTPRPLAPKPSPASLARADAKTAARADAKTAATGPEQRADAKTSSQPRPGSTTSPKSAPVPAPASGSRAGAEVARGARARHDPPPSRGTLFPMVFGLAGGAVAGALIVTLFFLRPVGDASTPATPAAASHHAASSTAAIAAPVGPPVVEPVAPAVTPADSMTDVEPKLDAPPVTLPHSLPPARVKAGPRTVASRTHSAEHITPAPAGRAVPTDDEAWPLLCGEVVDETGAPVAGARILLADLDVGARTDRRGRFCLSAPSGDRTLSVIALGFATQRRTVSVAAGAADLHLVLKTAP